MAAVLIVAHAPLATSLLAVAAHTFPDCALRAAAVDVQAQAAPEQVEADLRAAALLLGAGELLILADVAGATPCNVAERLVAQAPAGMRIKLLAGANVSMLWRTLCYAHEPLEALVARALSGGVQGVMAVGTSTPPQQQKGSPLGHDQVQHHHQQ